MDEIERLERQIDKLCTEMSRMEDEANKHIDLMAKEYKALEVENVELMEALRPFADAWEKLSKQEMGETPLLFYDKLFVWTGDFRKAHEALSATTDTQGDSPTNNG